MARCLVGVFILAAGLVVLAAAAKQNRSVEPSRESSNDKRTRRREAIDLPRVRRTLMLPAPPFQIRFSFN